MKKEKHEFSQIEIKFLGQLVSKKQIQMDGSKVATIQDWPFPIKTNALHKALGGVLVQEGYLVAFEG
ncbi:hypothetical protein CK203_099558 [Vitis vinifera]|uniref:Uncharacterized protein n=1 Tax=Vitis vinifera TaxID=29760 RepID=A0A438CJ19_VITVI|nr:hypothetical protein CK203_099558 [Vitis vinifera]